MNIGDGTVTSAASTTAVARFLPEPLIRARASVFDPLNCLDLNMTARRVLFGALTFLSIKNLERAIFPRRDTLRVESQLSSVQTLYRGLQTLEEKGYITREQIRKARDGKFHLSPIRLTEKALALLDLKRLIHSSPSPKVRGGHIKKELTNDQQSLKNTTGEPNDFLKLASKKDEPAIDRATGLPSELTFLLDLGVAKSAICWLMKTARKAGKRLSDVAAVVQRSIASLRGREVVAYLKAMIGKQNIDYAFIAKQQHQEQVSEQQAAQENAHLATLDYRYDGFYAFDRRASKILGIFHASSSGHHISAIDGRGSMPVNRAFAAAVLADKIELLSPSTYAQMTQWLPSETFSALF